MKAQWEKVDSNLQTMHRLEVPGGWLVYLFYSYHRDESYGGDRGTESQHGTLVFYPDPEHEWKQPSIVEQRESRDGSGFRP